MVDCEPRDPPAWSAADIRAYSMMGGLAAGDRIGGPTRMAQVLAESLVVCDGLDTADLGARWLKWWRKEGFDTGPVFAKVLARVSEGESFETAARAVDAELGGLTAGVNAAHRAVPLAACFAIADDALADAARAQARLTHLHPEAGDTAAAVVLLCRALVQGFEWPVALDWARDRLGSTAQLLPFPIPPATHRGGHAPHTLADALWFVDRAGSFDAALAASIAFAGPENYCPVLVGAIAGARWGKEELVRKLTP